MIVADDGGNYISVDEACEILIVSRPTMFRWLRAGRLDRFHVGARTVVRRDQVMALIEPSIAEA